MMRKENKKKGQTQGEEEGKLQYASKANQSDQYSAEAKKESKDTTGLASRTTMMTRKK
jgi:hypothetical protein